MNMRRTRKWACCLMAVIWGLTGVSNTVYAAQDITLPVGEAAPASEASVPSEGVPEAASTVENTEATVPSEVIEPTPEATAAPTPEAEATSVPTPAAEATATPAAEATAAPTPAAEATATPAAATATPAATVMPSPAVMTLRQGDLFGGETASGNIVVDGDLQDWENVSGIYVGAENIDTWKVAVSPDKSTLYICMNGVAENEWDYNFQWKVLTFSVEGQYNGAGYQFGSLNSTISGAQVVMKNGANGNVEGDYAVECSIPVSALPTSNFIISLANTNIWAENVPVMDGIIKEPENTPIPVYNGINIDGNFEDWAAVAKTAGSCPSAEHPDCVKSTAMVFDGDYVYIYLEAGDSSNVFWAGTHSNSKFAITTDLGNTLLFTVNSDDTISGVDGAVSMHYGNQAEIAIPKSALPTYMKSLSFGFYLQDPMIRDVVNLVQEEEKGEFSGIIYDGLYGDWTYYPHQVIQYATAGTQENVVDGQGALYSDGDNLFGHVKCVMKVHQPEQCGLFTQAVTFKFGESDAFNFYPRFVTVDGSGNINWDPQFQNLPNGTYEYYMASSDAWHTSVNIADLNDADKMYGKMMITVTDVAMECEFYLELEKVAEKFGCNPEEFKVLKAQFGRIGQDWLITAGASSGAYPGILICITTVIITFIARKKRKGTIG